MSTTQPKKNKYFLINKFKLYLLNNHEENAIKYGILLIENNYFEDFWRTCLSIIIEYIHFLSPNLIYLFYKKFIKYKNLKKFDKCNIDIIFFKEIIEIIKNIAISYKQHLSLYIDKKSYNNIDTNQQNICKLLKSFNIILKKITFEKIQNHNICKNLQHKSQCILAHILAFKSDSILIQDNDFNINLYSHKCNNQNEINQLFKTIFNIILNHICKFKCSSTQVIVRTLIKIFYTKLLNSTGKESYIILNILFYFIFRYDVEYPKIIFLNSQELLHIYKQFKFRNLTLKESQKYLEIKTAKKSKTCKKKNLLESLNNNKKLKNNESFINELCEEVNKFKKNNVKTNTKNSKKPKNQKKKFNQKINLFAIENNDDNDHHKNENLETDIHNFLLNQSYANDLPNIIIRKKTSEQNENFISEKNINQSPEYKKLSNLCPGEINEINAATKKNKNLSEFNIVKINT